MKRIFLFVFFCLFSNLSVAQNPIEQTFKLINHNRKLHNLNELTWNQKLANAAQLHSNWMAKVGKMEHLQGPYPPKSFQELKICNNHPVNRIIKSGYYDFDSIFIVKYVSNSVNVTQIPNVDDVWGEIIAHGRSNGDKFYPYRADICVRGWMNSPGHRAQILKPSFREMGIAISKGKNGSEAFWCVNFGSRDFILER